MANNVTRYDDGIACDEFASWCKDAGGKRAELLIKIEGEFHKVSGVRIMRHPTAPERNALVVDMGEE
jgi:hypothetical protein